MHRIESSSPSRIIGLMEILEDLGTTTDIAKLDDSLDEERTILMNLLDDAESLNMIKVDNGDVSLTDTGRKFLSSSIEERKKQLKELIRNVEPFNSLIAYFKAKNVTELPKEEVSAFLSETFPPGENDNTLRVILTWGRYTKLISYDSDDGIVRLND
ncbi:MAG: AAA-associated domain-containing protein [Thermoplasmatales archaeon]